MNNSDDSDGSDKEEWKNELKLYTVLSRTTIIYVTNYNKNFCDILFEIKEGDEDIIPLIIESLDKNNEITKLKKTTFNLLSKRQIEIKNLWRRSYVRKFISCVYMKGMTKFLDQETKNIKPRSLKSFCIDKNKND